VVFCLFTRWFTAPALLAGWAVGLFGGSLIAWSDGLKPLHAITIGNISFTAYIGLIALLVNIAVAVLVNLAMPSRRTTAGTARASS
jgi:SSS family solute:Na+ symporter